MVHASARKWIGERDICHVAHILKPAALPWRRRTLLARCGGWRWRGAVLPLATREVVKIRHALKRSTCASVLLLKCGDMQIAHD